MQYPVNLIAGQWVPLQVSGRFFMLMDTGALSAVAIRFWRGSQVLEEIETAKRGVKARTVEGFTKVEFRAAASGILQVIVSDGLVEIDAAEGATVKVTADAPLPVSNDRGSPGNLLYVAGVSLADAPAAALLNAAPVACSQVAAQVVPVNAARRAIRFANLGPDPVALGAAGITWANRVIVLEAGDVFLEDRAANLAWHAITAAGGAASVTRQEVTA